MQALDPQIMRRTHTFFECMFTVQGLDRSVAIENRERLIEFDAVIEPSNQLLAISNKNHSSSDEHFGVDGTLIPAWAGRKNRGRKDGTGDESGNF